jgi:hypothetical protein
VCAALAVGAALVCLAAAGSVATAAASPVGYADPSADGGGGPDIVGVAISNDDAGTISAAVQFANRSELGAGELVSLDLDTDRNLSTGEPWLGWDYGIDLQGDRALLYRYDKGARDWILASGSTVTSAWSGTTLTLRVGAGELGRPRSLRFEVYADAAPLDTGAPFDVAPDVGREWLYDVELPPAKPTIRSLDCTPEPAVAGRLLTAKAVVASTRSASPASTIRIAWQATYGPAKLRPLTARARGGVLVSTWRLPAAVRAPAVRVTLTITSEGVTATKTHLHRVAARATAAAPSTRLRPVFKVMLLSPTPDQVIRQNDPTTGCPAGAAGSGFRIQFAWKANHRKAVGVYHLVVQGRSAAYPMLDRTGPEDSYAYTGCGYVTPDHLQGWEWEVTALDGHGSSASQRGRFQFGPPA